MQIGGAHGWCTDEIRPWLVDGPMGYGAGQHTCRPIII